MTQADPGTSPRKRRSPPLPSSRDLSILPDASDDAIHSEPVELVDHKSDYNETFVEDDEDFHHPSLGLVRDLETRAITVSQLIQEVKGIYAGLGRLLSYLLEIC